MTKLKFDLFTLARLQLEKKKRPFTPLDVVDRAILLRKKLDEQEIKKHRKSNKQWYAKRRR